MGAVDSLMIIRNGYVVAEAYWHPFAQNLIYEQMSASKSVISALVGIAIDKGYIESVDQKVLDFFPEITAQNLDDNKQAMTIRDLLTMSSGFNCDITRTDTDPAGDLVLRPDATAIGLGWPMADAPGSSWRYCQINVYLLSAILTRTTRMSTLEFAQQNLFTPLGITDADWNISAEGVELGFAGLRLTTRDMAKFGYLFLNDGRWGDAQIVPADWVAASTQSAFAPPWSPFDGYGYLWWTYDTTSGHFFEAQGAYFQRIEVSTDEHLVVAVTATDNMYSNSNIGSPSFMQSILRMIKSDESLPANPDGETRLQEAIDAAANPVAQPEPELPELAAQVSGATFRLETPDLLFPEADINRRPTEDWQMATIGFDFSQSDAVLRLQSVSGKEVSIAVGLDDVYRVTPSYLETIAARGHWLTDTRFRLDLRRLEQGLVLRYVMNFSEDGLTGSVISQRPGDWPFIAPIGGRLSGQLEN